MAIWHKNDIIEEDVNSTILLEKVNDKTKNDVSMTSQLTLIKLK